MKAKTVYENLGFERGQVPSKSLKIGKYSNILVSSYETGGNYYGDGPIADMFYEAGWEKELDFDNIQQLKVYVLLPEQINNASNIILNEEAKAVGDVVLGYTNNINAPHEVSILYFDESVEDIRVGDNFYLLNADGNLMNDVFDMSESGKAMLNDTFDMTRKRETGKTETPSLKKRIKYKFEDILNKIDMWALDIKDDL